MKKRLRFEMPHVPLKVLRGQQDEEDIQDQYYQRFQAPGTTTEEEAERTAEDDSTTSHSSHEDVTTDMGEVTEDGMERYLGQHIGTMHSVKQVDGDFGENPNYQNENTPQYDKTGSVNLEAADVQVVTQVHCLPNTDVTSNDSVDLSNHDRAPLLPNKH